MEKYPLVKLVGWAGPEGIKGRRRLQKVTFFLQKAGCPFEAEYTLHHYGPYSRDVAEACDELVAAGLLEEQTEINGVGTQFTYRVATPGVAALAHTEERLGARAAQLSKFAPLANELISSDLWELELGSTILFFHDKANDWVEAVRLACEFKKINRQTNTSVPPAEALAKKIHARAETAV